MGAFDLEPRAIAIAALLLLGLLVVQTLRLAWVRAAPRRRLAESRRRGALGEREAEGLLRSAGYRIEARQPRAELAYGLDGEELVVEVRADLLVRRGARRFIAEVKTGELATALANRATRRQLLEYAHAFDVDGVLLVDADEGRVSVVRVPTRAAPRAGIAWVAVAIGLVVALVAGALVARAAVLGP